MNSPERSIERERFARLLLGLIKRPPVSVSFPYGEQAVRPR